MGPALIDPTFDLTLGQPGRSSPLVFASPHSGVLYPDDMRHAEGLSQAALRSAEDASMDRLLSSASLAGVPLLAGRMGRAYLDLNRSTDDLDPLLIQGCPTETAPNAKTQAGYGIVPRLTGEGAPLYDRLLSVEEVMGRIAQVHAPYYAALSGLMTAAHRTHGRAILVDWHSMPWRATGPNGADVVLGDRHGTSCTVALTRRLRALFEGIGWRVALNRPFAGGYATQSWGRPNEGYEAIQIELSRRLYWNEDRGEPSVGWNRCQSGINHVIAMLAAELSA